MKAPDIGTDPRMVALVDRITGERAQAEEHFAHRIDALEATIREEHHRDAYGHYPIAGEGGKCAYQVDGKPCDVIVHPAQAA